MEEEKYLFRVCGIEHLFSELNLVFLIIRDEGAPWTESLRNPIKGFQQLLNSSNGFLTE